MNDLVKDAEALKTIFARQLGIYNPHSMQNSVAIVGVGAVGSFTALGLAKLGVKSIEVWDHDEVEDVNLPIQAHAHKSIGLNKALATKELIGQMMPECKVYAHPEKWDGQDLKADIIISGADSLPVRKQVWEAIKYDPSVKIMCDARVGGQMMKLFYISPVDEADVRFYDGTFKDMKGAELPCAERGIVDVALFAASLHVRAIRRWLVKGEKEQTLSFNLGGKFKSIMDV